MLAILSQQRDIRPYFVVVKVAKLQAKIRPYQHVAVNALRLKTTGNQKACRIVQRKAKVLEKIK